VTARVEVQLARNAAVLAECHRVIRSNRRLDHWWNPFRSASRANIELLELRIQVLEKADQLLRETFGIAS
jgi:hypothetical protein